MDFFISVQFQFVFLNSGSVWNEFFLVLLKKVFGSDTTLSYYSSYKVAVITYKTRSTSKPAYLSDLLQDYRPARTLPSSDKLLLCVPRMTLAFSTRAFSVSAPSVWNLLSYQCRSAELFSSFRCILKTELFNIAYSDRKQSA